MLLALLLLAAPVEKLDAFVARIVAAYGGEDALKRVKSLRETGTLDSPRGKAKTLRLFTPPGRLRVQIDYAEGKGEIRILDGESAFRSGEKVQGPPRDAMVLQAARLDLPFLLLRSRAKLVDLGDLDRDGKTLRGIGIPLENGLNVAVTVDPKSARIVRSEGALPGPGGQQIRFATDYADFKPVQGVLFAFHEANFASGQQTGVTTLEKIELLDSLPEASFKP